MKYSIDKNIGLLIDYEDQSNESNYYIAKILVKYYILIIWVYLKYYSGKKHNEIHYIRQYIADRRYNHTTVAKYTIWSNYG